MKHGKEIEDTTAMNKIRLFSSTSGRIQSTEIILISSPKVIYVPRNSQHYINMLRIFVSRNRGGILSTSSPSIANGIIPTRLHAMNTTK